MSQALTGSGLDPAHVCSSQLQQLGTAPLRAQPVPGQTKWNRPMPKYHYNLLCRPHVNNSLILQESLHTMGYSDLYERKICMCSCRQSVIAVAWSCCHHELIMPTHSRIHFIYLVSGPSNNLALPAPVYRPRHSTPTSQVNSYGSKSGACLQSSKPLFGATGLHKNK